MLARNLANDSATRTLRDVSTVSAIKGGLHVSTAAHRSGVQAMPMTIVTAVARTSLVALPF